MTAQNRLDISPCDYYMKAIPLKEVLWGEGFSNDTVVQSFVHKWLKGTTLAIYDASITKLPIHCENCVLKSENYIVKYYVTFCFVSYTDKLT